MVQRRREAREPMTGPSIVMAGQADNDGQAAAADAPTSIQYPKDQPIEPEGMGPLLDLPEPQAATLGIELWEMDPKEHKRQRVHWHANGLRRSGKRFVRVVDDPDSDARVWVPPAEAWSSTPVPNHCDRLIRRTIDTVTVDPAKLEAQTSSDESSDRDAAEFGTRFLEVETGEAGLNIPARLGRVMGIGGTYGSGFSLVSCDPKGGGHTERRIMAHPEAQHVAEAVTGPVGAASADLVTKYVLPGGALSSSPAGAERVWLPKIIARELNGKQLKVLPRGAPHAHDADGIVCAWFTTWGQFAGAYPNVRKLAPEQQWAMCTWEPKDAKSLLPPGRAKTLAKKDERKQADAPPRDDAPVCAVYVWYRSCPLYPYGAHVVIAGGKYRVHRSTWTAQMPTGKQQPDGMPELREEALLLPVAQCRWMTDDLGENVYGESPAVKLGNLDEINATVVAGILENLYLKLHPNTLVPHGTIIQPEAWGRRDGTPIAFNAAAGRPEFEQIPDLPAYVMGFLEWLQGQSEDEAGLKGAALGQTPASITSGEQQKVAIEQALVALTSVQRGAREYLGRIGRLILQEARRSYTTPQRVGYVTDGGAYKEQEFTRADLGGTKDVRITRGTFTMKAPEQKAALLQNAASVGVISMERAALAQRRQLSLTLGVDEDKAYLRVKRQIHAWQKGPDASVMQQIEMQPPLEPQMAMGPDGQPMVGPDGAPVMQPPPDPLALAAEAVFDPLPVDDEPANAKTRWLELSDYMQEPKWKEQPEGWRAGYLAVYDRARRAAGVQTLQEQAMAQQAAAVQQQAAEGQASDRKHAQTVDRDARKSDLRQQVDASRQAAGEAQGTEALAGMA